ncbi:MAG: glycoside hydrolase family 92 protein, partial [Tannerella sp.]|nr:glycoside hydrolase family 92 protein [Tannerella sp.]
MNKRKALGCLLVGFVVFSSCVKEEKTEVALENLTQYVDPYIGTGDHGHVFMGANVPFGLVQLGPSNIPQTWDWCSGYHISDSTIIGFSHMHLNGTGIGDLGDVNFMPAIGEVNLSRGSDAGDYGTGKFSLFDR